MREAELNIDIWTSGPSAFGAEVLSGLIVDLLDERHIPDIADARQIFRIANARSAHIPEGDQSIAHWNVSFMVRWARAAFAEKLIARG
jgi:hypothetical protein